MSTPEPDPAPGGADDEIHGKLRELPKEVGAMLVSVGRSASSCPA